MAGIFPRFVSAGSIFWRGGSILDKTSCRKENTNYSRCVSLNPIYFSIIY